MDELLGLLEKEAAAGRTVLYGTIMRRFGLARGKYGDVGNVLGIVSEYTQATDGIWLSAIVVTKTDYPVAGFLGLNDIPDELYREGNYQRPLSDKEKGFIRGEQQRVFDWAKKRKGAPPP